ncbi:MAG TPA: FAD-binding protein [Polyangiaceae bacterium]|nr:FAD-binding protein [Polyangiaceae bacterium]
MAKQPLLTFEENKHWQNYHRTSLVGGTVDRFFTPRNVWADGSRDPKAFLPGLRALQEIVCRAEAGRRRVRAVGSGWSLSNAAFSEEYLVNTCRLNYWFVGFNDPEMVAPEWRTKRDRLVFAQCGVQIKTLNGHLQGRRLSLMTSGASNGQTIVGAMSTGTHGSARDVGSMQDFVLGLHIVGEGGKHYFIQRKSRPVVTDAFAEWLDCAKLVLDDDVFLAAVVSFGSFGLIHGVLFEVEPIYLLERHVRRYDYLQVVHAAQTLDLAGLELPHPGEAPFHFEIVINPYRLLAGEKGAFVRVLYKRPAGAELPPAHFSETRLQNSEDLVSIAGFFADVAPSVIPDFLQSELDDALEVTPTGGVIGTHGQQFGDSYPTGGGASTEIGVPLARVGDALRVVLESAQEAPFGAPLALRYVKSSEAFLAFTCFSPVTCAFEMPGVDAARTRDGHRRIWQALSDERVPHTFHWGQALPQNAEWPLAGFPDERVSQWLAARRRFLGPSGRSMFQNALLSRCGLAG